MDRIEMLQHAMFGEFLKRVDSITRQFSDKQEEVTEMIARLKEIRETAIALYDADILTFDLADRIWDYATEVIQKYN
jgi:hypothetical protein